MRTAKAIILVLLFCGSLLFFAPGSILAASESTATPKKYFVASNKENNRPPAEKKKKKSFFKATPIENRTESENKKPKTAAKVAQANTVNVPQQATVRETASGEKSKPVIVVAASPAKATSEKKKPNPGVKPSPSRTKATGGQSAEKAEEKAEKKAEKYEYSIPKDYEMMLPTRKKMDEQAELLKETEPLLPQTPPRTENLLTEEEALGYMYLHHPDIGVKRAEVMQQEAKLQQVYAKYDPKVFLRMDRISQKGSPIQPWNTMDALFDVSYVLYDWDQRKQQLVTIREYIDSAKYSINAMWIDRARAVKAYYAEVVLREWLVVVQQDDLAKAQDNLQIAEGFYNSGTKSRIDVTQAQLEVAQSELELAQAIVDLRTARINLAEAIGVDVSEIANRTLIDVLQARQELPEQQAALTELDRSNPYIQAYRASIRGSEAYARALEMTKRPTLSSSAYYGGTGTGLINSDIWNVGVNLSVPLFADNQVYSQVDEQKAITLQTQKNLEKQKLTLTTQLENAYSDATGADARRLKAEEEVRTAILNYVLAHKRYKSGVTTFIIELNQARDNLNGARKQYVSILFDRKDAEYRYQNAVGLPCIPEPTTQVPISGPPGTTPPILLQSAPTGQAPPQPSPQATPTPAATRTPTPGVTPQPASTPTPQP